METNTLTQEEFDYIKSIDTGNYLIDNIDTENDPIYKKLSELDIINNPEKTKQCLHNLVEKFTVIEDDTEDIDKIEFYKFIFCIHVNFIKILEKEGNLSSLIDILSNCGLFDFVESEQLVSSLQNFTYAASINFDEHNNELLHNLILKLCKDNVNNIDSIVNGYVAGYLFNREDVSNLINFINVLINNNPDNIGVIFDAFIQGCLSQNLDNDTIINYFFENEINLNDEKLKNIFIELTKTKLIMFNNLILDKLLSYNSIGDVENFIIKIFKSSLPSNNELMIKNLMGIYLQSNDVKIKNIIIRISEMNPLIYSNIISDILVVHYNNGNKNNIDNFIEEFNKLYPSIDFFSLILNNSIKTYIKNNNEIAKNCAIEFFKKDIDKYAYIIYNLIENYYSNKVTILNTGNINRLIDVVTNLSDNDNKITKILCGFYVSDHLFKIYNSKNSDNFDISEEYKKLFNMALKRGVDNKITK